MTGFFWKRVRALLATARVANVPSVVSNVWVGAVLAEVLDAWVTPRDSWSGAYLPSEEIWWLAAAGVCLYVAGNFLNDWHDREWDGSHRPERALPSGLFCPSTYLAVAVGLVIMAGVCAWVVGPVTMRVAVGILVFVVAYTVLHKRTGWGVVWIGGCRALLIVLGVTGVVDRPQISSPLDLNHLSPIVAGLISIPLFCYIIGLSVSARFEAKAETPEWARLVSLGMLVLPMSLVCGGYFVYARSFPWLWAVLPYAAWMSVCYRRKTHIPRYVGGLLAGIPLVDLMVLSSGMAFVARFTHDVSPVIYLVPVAAFLAGLLLQRVAPAS